MQFLSKCYNWVAQILLHYLPLSCIIALPLYTANLSAQCKLSPETQLLLQQTKRIARTSESISDSLVFAYVMIDEGANISNLRQCGVKTNTKAGKFLTAQIPLSRLQWVAEQPFVKYVQLARIPKQQLDKAHLLTQVPLLQAGQGLDQPYTGRGVIIGVIDAGFDYTHPAFVNPETGELRIARVWEQGAQGNPPEGFSYGVEFKTPTEIISAGGDVKKNSHGTHVACIAAGSNVGNSWYGVAPEAEIVLVGISGAVPNNVNISDALAYIYNYAEKTGKPCVVNMSLGTPIGPHDGTSPFDQIADALQGAGKLLVGAAGNDGADKLHVSRTFVSSEDAPLQTMIDFKTSPDENNVGGEIDIWGTAGAQFQLVLHVFNYSTQSVVQSSETIIVGDGESNSIPFELTKNSKGTIRITTETNPINGRPHALISLGVTSLRTRHAVALEIVPLTPGRIDAWSDNSYSLFTNKSLQGWQDGDTDCTIGEIGGTGNHLLTVGAYTSRNEYTTLGSTVVETLPETVGDIASFSAVGPTIDGRNKPEITAPGTYVISALSNHDIPSATPIAAVLQVGDKEYYYGYMQGTSMAAPYLTGIAALLLQSSPNLTPSGFKSSIVQTALVDEYTGDAHITDPHWGAGKVDAYAALCRVLSTSAIQNEPHINDFTISRSGDDVILRFKKHHESVFTTIVDASGRMFHKGNFSVRCGEEVEIPLQNLKSGMYILSVQTAEKIISMKILR